MKAGDHVVTCLSAFCGHCEFCVTGRLSLCLDASTQAAERRRRRALALDGDAGRTNCSTSPACRADAGPREWRCVAIDRDMPLDRAAVIGCAVTTGAGAIFNALQADARARRVAVIGCGGIGLAAINAAKIAGAGPDHRARSGAGEARAGREAGRDRQLSMPAAEDCAKQIVELTKGGVHHAIEAVGRTAVRRAGGRRCSAAAAPRRSSA